MEQRLKFRRGDQTPPYFGVGHGQGWSDIFHLGQVFCQRLLSWSQPTGKHCMQTRYGLVNFRASPSDFTPDARLHRLFSSALLLLFRSATLHLLRPAQPASSGVVSPPWSLVAWLAPVSSLGQAAWPSCFTLVMGSLRPPMHGIGRVSLDAVWTASLRWHLGIKK